MSKKIDLSTSSNEVIHASKEEWHVSKSGKVFDLNADRWQLDARRKVNISEIRTNLLEPLKEGAIRTLAHDAETLAPLSVIGRCKTFKSFMIFSGNQIGKDIVSLAAIISFRQHNFARDGHDVITAALRSILKTWFQLGYPGVTQDQVDQMKSWRLKNREPAIAVNSTDINKGPFTTEEQFSIQSLSNIAFENGLISIQDFSLIRLISITGRRPLQLAQLKIKDLDDSRFADQSSEQIPRKIYLLHIPRVKVKGGLWRTRYRAVPLTMDIWNLLDLLRKDVAKRFNKILEKIDIQMHDHDIQAIHGELPLFPIWSILLRSMVTINSLIKQSKHGEAIRYLREIISSDECHYQAQGMDDAIDRTVNLICAMNRKGELLKVFPRRFRYTLESNLERLGYSPPIIAWNMDHSNTRSLISYSKNGPDKARAITKTMALGMATYVKIFQGIVVDSEAAAEGGKNPESSRIIFNEGITGATCATLRNCGLTAIPRPCYGGCPHFRPWVDGPHEQFLESILEERQRDMDAGVDKKILEANDQLILGIVQVINICEEHRKKSASEINDEIDSSRKTL